MADAEALPVVEQANYLEMSDEDILKAPVPDFTAAPQVVVAAPVAPEIVAPPTDKVDDVKIVSEDATSKDVDAGTAASPVDVVAEVKTSEKVGEVGQVEVVVTDFEAEYKRLLAPFKANGREIAPKSVDDAISLMQMGANYNKKMAALKPNLKLMKLLENNGLLSEERISFLIDLGKNSPEAINKLVKDSGLNPMDFDAEKAGEYKPKIHTVDDREIDLDTVLDEISSTPSYNRTLEIVSKEWDGPSKQAIAGAPQLLKVINDHVSRGIYDVIHAEVDRERMFGRLNGLSDIEAYRQVGDVIQAKGGFNHLGSPQGTPTTDKPVVVIPKPKVENDTLNDKRRAASSTKVAAPSSMSKDFNPLAMSDEEFGKLAHTQYR